MVNLMQVTASAPGKAILFGEHAVVYGKPAIAMAINKRACIDILECENNKINVNITDLGITGYVDMNNDHIISDSPKKGILKYILESLKRTHDGSGLEINVDVNIPLNHTDLHTPFVGLQNILKPYAVLLNQAPNSWYGVFCPTSNGFICQWWKR